MTVDNPNALLRTACKAALETATGLSVFAKNVPKSTPVPAQYILLTTQTKTRTEIAKPDSLSGTSDNFDWLVSIVIDICSVGPVGFASPGKNDTVETNAVRALEVLKVTGWCVKSSGFVQSVDLDIATAENFIERKVLTYQYWMKQL